MRLNKHSTALFFLSVFTLMLLHNLVPHVHSTHSDFEHEIVHEGHHHGHAHHHHHHHDGENKDKDYSDLDNFLHHLIAHHGHACFSHEHIPLVRIEKQNIPPSKHLFKKTIQSFTLKPQLVYDIGNPYPKRGTDRHFNPFLRNCSLRAPPTPA